MFNMKDLKSAHGCIAITDYMILASHLVRVGNSRLFKSKKYNDTYIIDDEKYFRWVGMQSFTFDEALSLLPSDQQELVLFAINDV